MFGQKITTRYVTARCPAYCRILFVEGWPPLSLTDSIPIETRALLLITGQTISKPTRLSYQGYRAALLFCFILFRHLIESIQLILILNHLFPFHSNKKLSKSKFIKLIVCECSKYMREERIQVVPVRWDSREDETRGSN